MKRAATILCALCAVTVVLPPAFAQDIDPCSQTAQLTGGTLVEITSEWQKTGSVQGTSYGYELWHNKNTSSNKVSMKYYGAGQGGGAAFRGEWNEPNTEFDYLARIGYKLDGDKKLYTQYDNIYADYSYNRSSRLDGDNYSYIGIYGWARSGNGAPLVEYYIVDDWWGNRHQGDNTPVGPSTVCNSCSQTGSNVTIDGGTYKIYKNSRTNEPSIEGDNSNFDQYFSVRQTPRKCGTISVTEHFKAWNDRDLKMGTLYEVALLAEAGAYGVHNEATVTSGWIDYSYAAMRIGGSPIAPPEPGADCITLPASPPADAYNTCFKHTNGKCYVCSTRNETEENSCLSEWVWDGNNVDDNLDKGYWYDEVDCPAITPITIIHSQLPILNSKPIYYTLQGTRLGSMKPNKSGIYIIKEGYSVKKLVVK
jgi:endo-1,4-beta-xylanase